MASDAESDGFGAFDFAEFTSDDFAQIDKDVASRFIGPSTSVDDLGSDSSSSSSSDSSDEQDRDEEQDKGRSGVPDIANESFEFNASLDLFALAEEDFLAMDDAVNIRLNTPQPSTSILPPDILDPPRIAAPLEDFLQPRRASRYRGKGKGKARDGKLWRDKSLLERYKPAGILSVTDLVSPTWCEVQIDYGLRQKRWKPVDKRPKTFKTDSGKEITVEIKVAEQNDVRTKQGQAVHTVLEREVRPEEIKVDIRTSEERWGLKLLNLITCFEGLMGEGMTREVQVFGMLHGVVVTGIIDELSLVEKPVESPKRRLSTPTPRKASKRVKRTPTPDPKQRDIEDFFLPSPKKSDKGKRPTTPRPTSPSPSSTTVNGQNTPRVQHVIHVLDTKTRQTDTLPAEADTQGSQLQLMLYHYLLSALTSRSTPFNFEVLWEYLGLDSQRQFGDGFLVQAGLWDNPGDVASEVGPSMRNLADLGRAWRNLLEARSTLAGVDDKMELVYRLQSTSKGKGKGRASAPGDLQSALRSLVPQRDEVTLTKEAKDLAVAIRNSLFDASMTASWAHGNNILNGSHITEGLDVGGGLGAEIDVELQNALFWSFSAVPGPSAKPKEQSRKAPPKPKPHPMFARDPSPPPVPLSPPPDPPMDLEPQGAPPESANLEPQGEFDIHGFKIIGRKQVVYDQAKLDAHLESVFQFWRSERKPVGVPVELARRCNTCEYRNGCEWREEKAMEAVASVQARRHSSS